jgi:hypothetical protein
VAVAIVVEVPIFNKLLQNEMAGGPSTVRMDRTVLTPLHISVPTGAGDVVVVSFVEDVVVVGFVVDVVVVVFVVDVVVVGFVVDVVVVGFVEDEV